ncbi:hypothetical protein [Chromobacterium vaccinii]|uniref:hypothetical protein n=1 Tax=Chromobacterium vaccinii TaxID=1108595 RepID=UPI000E18851C|nr:hypothetical protein [Chromobacterium vaccinii]SUX55338.1 Uncharacterised protein [Chromobacterium vaccinii]
MLPPVDPKASATKEAKASFPPYALNRDHTVSVIYPSHEEAEGVRQRLIASGIAINQMHILHQAPQAITDDGRDEVLKNILVDGAIGTAVGAGAGVAGTLILMAEGITLFISSPAVAPLVMLGWFASLGGMLGSISGVTAPCSPKAGAARKEGRFSELVMDAIQTGNTVLIVHTHNMIEQGRAKTIIGESLQDRDKILTGHRADSTDSD